MHTRALLYAGFLTAAVALLLASGGLRRPGNESAPTDTVATNR